VTLEYKEKMRSMARERVDEIKKAGLCVDEEVAVLCLLDSFHGLLFHVLGDLPPHTQDFFMMKFRALYDMSVSAGRKIVNGRQELLNLEAGKILDGLGEDLEKSSLTRSEKSAVMGSIHALLAWIFQTGQGMPPNVLVLFVGLIQAQLRDMVELHSLDPGAMN